LVETPAFVDAMKLQIKIDEWERINHMKIQTELQNYGFGVTYFNSSKFRRVQTSSVKIVILTQIPFWNWSRSKRCQRATWTLIIWSPLCSTQWSCQVNPLLENFYSFAHRAQWKLKPWPYCLQPNCNFAWKRTSLQYRCKLLLSENYTSFASICETLIFQLCI